MWQTLKSVLDAFGSTIFVPVMLFIVALCLKTPVKKAFMSGLLAGVGLVGFNMITGSYGAILAPVVNKLVQEANINLPAMDLGWQSTATIAYSTDIGMIFIGVAILLQFLLFLCKWTNVFMPSDLWNNYSFIVWGSLIYVATGNTWLAIGCMVLQNLYILLFAEVIQKRWASYYGYPGTVMTAPHHIGHVPFCILLDWLLNKLGADRINLRPEPIQKKLGFLGEPMTIGLIVGAIIGICGNMYHLTELAAWGQTCQFAVATAAVMAIFPKIAAIFASAFTAITDASKKAVKGSTKQREWYLAVNDALGYGETATLTTGLLLIPITLVLSFILPGNIVLPVMSFTALAYRVEINICLSDGNIFKSVIAYSIIFCGSLYIASANAEFYTQVAKSVGIDLPEGALLVIGMIAANIFMHLIYRAFLSQNPIWIGISVVVYFALYFWYRKNKPVMDEFLEKNVYAYKEKLAAKGAAV
ncbi:PTS galactitol transporter subunit IIC [Youxingia wuxianensis]|uniref:PTS galactitol transporter subunit IIC n=1 Tax=Youxingia wuxianensis TaxID=2763678 RepID=A0A926IHV6_9FIRM|nr:PTS transporter subunit IIC [Youxingia wuxianensis]MBC8585525.1 PTS galactitol transporter subunit IIC [Youxingia wuxianensis]